MRMSRPLRSLSFPLLDWYSGCCWDTATDVIGRFRDAYTHADSASVLTFAMLVTRGGKIITPARPGIRFDMKHSAISRAAQSIGECEGKQLRGSA